MYGEISQRLLSVILLVQCSIISDIKSTAVKQVYIGAKDCDLSTNYVGEHDIYELVWKDEKRPFLCDNRWFKGGSSGEYRDKYKVCVKPSEWVIQDCYVKINYYFGFNRKPAQTFGCNRSPIEVCTGSTEFLRIELAENTTRGVYYPGSKFRLTITASKTFDYSDNAALIGGIVGGVIGVIVLVLIIIAVIVFICICIRKRPHSSSGGHVFQPGQSGQTNMAMTSVAVTHTGQSLPANAYPRQTYPTQQYPPTQQFTPQNNVSTPGLQDKSELTYDAVQLEPGEVMI